MRERGAIAIYTVLVIITVVFFSMTSEISVQSADLDLESSGPGVIINGRLFEANVIEQGEDGRMIIIVDREDLFAGENTLEIHWGPVPPTTMTAELPSEVRQH